VALRQNWSKLMHQTIRLEVGEVWQLRGLEVGGVEKTKVTYQNPDGLGKKNPRSNLVFLATY
tara:strand:- start:2744 stop:2929 length:186 start_codon:yes stop_codon:yes gene_type:complete